MAIKSKAKTIYDTYLNKYLKWSEKHGDDSMQNFREYLSKNHKTSYVNHIMYVLSKTRNEFTNEELKALEDHVLKNYEHDSLATMIIIILKTGMRINEVLTLTKTAIRNHENSAELFNYLPESEEDDSKIFKRSYHTYLSKFKALQRVLFPNRKPKSFNKLKKNARKYREKK